MKICPYCESELSDTARKCRFCGEWVPQEGKSFLSSEDFDKHLKLGSDGTNKIKYLTDKQSDVFSNYNCNVLELKGLKEINDYQAKAIGKYESAIYLTGLKKLTNKQVEYLTKNKKSSFYLDGLSSITDIQAKYFGESNIFSLSLNGLKKITDKQSEYLSNFKGGEIYLDGLTEITDIQTENLMKFGDDNGYYKTLSLNGLKSITDKQSEILAQLKGEKPHLYLDGIKELSDKQMANLFKYKLNGGYLSIKGLEKITDEQAKLFSIAFEGDSVELAPTKWEKKDGNKNSGVTKFTDEQIEILASSKFTSLCLNGLNTITDNQAKALSNFKGEFLYLDGLESITENQANFFAHSKCMNLGLNGLKSISNNQLQKIMEFNPYDFNLSIKINSNHFYNDFTQFYDSGDVECQNVLDGLNSISNEQLEIIIKNKNEIFLCNAEGITDKQMKIIVKFPGNGIVFKKLKKITDNQAESLAKFGGEFINLTGLEKITDNQANLLSKFNGRDVYFKYGCLTDKQKELLINLDPDRHYDENYEEDFDENENIDNIKREVTYFHNNKNQISSEKFYFNGEKDYELTEYFENGNIEGFRKVVDGVRVKRITYYNNGNIKYSMELRDGVRIIKEYDEEGHLLKDYKKLDKNKGYGFEGEYIEYYSSGNISEKGTYKNGSYVGEWIKYFENGKKEGVVNYKDGILQGEYKKYYENGKIKERGWYKNGKLEGDYIKYKENGEILEKNNYKNGEFKKTYSWIRYLFPCIIAGFIIPNETSFEWLLVICIGIALYIIYGMYQKKKNSEVIIYGILGGFLGVGIGTFVLGFVIRITSSIVLSLTYSLGIITPVTYSKIYCNKMAGSLDKHPCSIKGNVSFDTGEKIYHKPGCENYNSTVINESYGELLFPDEKTAQKAGFRKCKDDIIYDWEPGMYDDPVF